VDFVVAYNTLNLLYDLLLVEQLLRPIVVIIFTMKVTECFTVFFLCTEQQELLLLFVQLALDSLYSMLVVRQTHNKSKYDTNFTISI